MQGRTPYLVFKASLKEGKKTTGTRGKSRGRRKQPGQRYGEGRVSGETWTCTDWGCWRACAGAGSGPRLGAPGLAEVVYRKGLGLGGFERGRLVEVVREGFLGGLVLSR